MADVDLSLVRAGVMDRGLMPELLRGYRLNEVREIPASTNVGFKQLLKGTDVVIGGYGYREQSEAAKAASELGIPFITYPVITTVLPDGIPFDELEFPAYDVSPVLDLFVRAFQMIELLKLFGGMSTLHFAPDALSVHLDPDTLDLKVKRVKLGLKSG